MALDVKSAKVGNVKLSWLMEDKQLECHPDKTGYVVMGANKYKEDIKEEIEKECFQAY